MLTLTPDDINAIADAVALRLRGDKPAPTTDAAEAKRRFEIRQAGFELGRASKKGRTKKSATTTVPTGQPKATRTTTGA